MSSITAKRLFNICDLPKPPIQLWKDVSVEDQPVLVSALNRCRTSHLTFKNAEKLVNKLCIQVEHLIRTQQETIEHLMSERSLENSLEYLSNAVQETQKLETKVAKLFTVLEENSYEFSAGVNLLRESAHCAHTAAYKMLVKQNHDIAMAERAREEAFLKTQDTGMSWAKGILRSATIFSVQTWNITGAQNEQRRQEEKLRSLSHTKRTFLDPMRALAASMTRVSDTWAKVGRLVKKVNTDYRHVVRPLITQLRDGRDPELFVSYHQVDILQEDLQRVLHSVKDFQELNSQDPTDTFHESSQ